MLQNLFTDKGTFSKKAYKEYFNAKRLNTNFEIKYLTYDKRSKTLFVDIVKKLDTVETTSVCFPTGIEGKILTQFVNLNLNIFFLTYTVELESLKNEQKTLEFFNREQLRKEAKQLIEINK